MPVDAEPVTDFDAAYNNGGSIPCADAYPDRWAGAAAAFRAERAALGRLDEGMAYGPAERQRFDLFHPDGEARGLAVFVHGGYWKAFGRSDWSHLARGALARGFAVVLPGYTLCPQARIGEIGREIGAFLDRAAERVSGPIHLSGHSAGGQLVTRMASQGAAIRRETRERIAAVVSISGVHDLRPLRRTAMNDILRLDAAEAMAESPALNEPAVSCPITAYVGGDERLEFRRQTALLANVWHGLGARIAHVEEPGRHHFDVIEALEDPGSRLLDLLTETARV